MLILKNRYNKSSAAQIHNLLSNRNIIKEYFARSPLTHIKGIACSKTDKEFLENLNEAISRNITNQGLDVDQLSVIMNMSKAKDKRIIRILRQNEDLSRSTIETGVKVNEVAYKMNRLLASN